MNQLPYFIFRFIRSNRVKAATCNVRLGKPALRRWTPNEQTGEGMGATAAYIPPGAIAARTQLPHSSRDNNRVVSVGSLLAFATTRGSAANALHNGMLPGAPAEHIALRCPNTSYFRLDIRRGQRPPPGTPRVGSILACTRKCFSFWNCLALARVPGVGFN